MSDEQESARRRRARRAARRLPTNPYLQITSMTDMFTLILAFLLSFYDPNLVDAPSLVLPAVPVTGEVKDGLRMEVRTDGVYVDGTVVARLDGHGALAADVQRAGRVIVPLHDVLAARSGGDHPPDLLVSCDKSVPFGVLGDVLSTAAGAGFPDYRFVVESNR